MIKNPDTESIALPSKYDGMRFKADESVDITVSSSGGYGAPLERSAELVYEDVLDEIVSVENARALYGVVIEQGQLDLKATHHLRE